jgi:methyl-accepting chemotaxis protein
MGGTKLVADAAGQLSVMVGTARSNMTIMEVIAEHCSGQAQSVLEVSQAVRAIDEMTQHNAALVEQINASISQSEAQANELDQIVDIFSTEPETASRRSVA